MVHPFISAPNFVSVTPSMGVLFPILRRGKVSTLWSSFFLSFMCWWFNPSELLGVLASSYCCSSYGAANPLSSVGIFSSSFIGDPVFHPIADCAHPRLCLPGPGIVSQETTISGSFQQNLASCMQWCQRLEADYGMDPDMAVFRWSILSSQLQTLSL